MRKERRKQEKGSEETNPGWIKEPWRLDTMQADFANRAGVSQILLFVGDCGRKDLGAIVLLSDGARNSRMNGTFAGRRELDSLEIGIDR